MKLSKMERANLINEMCGSPLLGASTLSDILISVRELGQKDSGFFSSDIIQRTPVPPDSPLCFTKAKSGEVGNQPYYEEENEDEENEKWVGP